MNLYTQNISVSSSHEILFSHVRDIPRVNGHDFHLHDFMEIFIYVEGDVDFIVNQNYIDLHRGDIILANENILHKAVVKGTAWYERFYIGIPQNAFSHMDQSANPLACFSRGVCVISIGENDFRNILSLLRKMADLIETDLHSNAYTVYGYLLQILSILNRKTTIGSNGTPRRDSPHELISRVLAFLENSATQVNSVAEIAEHFHVSASYLSSLFSQDMDVTLKRYLMICKISKSKIMLSQGESVSNTGLACGFCTTSHFISVFREVTGMTPNAYRSSLMG